ncbi:MAG: GNAT family N-acetyltransferase [Nitrospirae bacterium]|nr:GNAT family N-acetyltransferase [Nitrospirota bacterium]
MPVVIREGHSVDAQQLQTLYRHAPWAAGRGLDGIKRMLENTDYIFSAWDGRRLVGFARVLTDRIYRATLWDVVVHPDYQGQGAGESLVKTILSHPVLSNVEKFWLNTRDKHAFYERFGFVRSDQGMVRDRSEKGDCCD